MQNCEQGLSRLLAMWEGAVGGHFLLAGGIYDEVIPKLFCREGVGRLPVPPPGRKTWATAASPISASSMHHIVVPVREDVPTHQDR
jgi:hypothetical protein